MKKTVGFASLDTSNPRKDAQQFLFGRDRCWQWMMKIGHLLTLRRVPGLFIAALQNKPRSSRAASQAFKRGRNHLKVFQSWLAARHSGEQGLFEKSDRPPSRQRKPPCLGTICSFWDESGGILKVLWPVCHGGYHLQVMNVPSIFWSLLMNPNDLSHRDYHTPVSVCVCVTTGVQEETFHVCVSWIQQKCGRTLILDDGRAVRRHHRGILMDV